MSVKFATHNRREALKMLFGTVVGAGILGGTTYLASDNYLNEKSESDALDVYNSGMADGLSQQQLAEIFSHVYKRDMDKTSMVAAALGALVGNYYYDWTTPDPDRYDFDLDY